MGIAEQHAVTFAAGLACEGLAPFCTIYSSFLQRGYDQIVHDVSLQKLPVRFAMDRAGLVGADGSTHCGAFDVTYMASLPNMVCMAPSNEAELINMVATSAAIDDRPSCFRFPRGNGLGLDLSQHGIGKDLKGTPLEVRALQASGLLYMVAFKIEHVHWTRTHILVSSFPSVLCCPALKTHAQALSGTHGNSPPVFVPCRSARVWCAARARMCACWPTDPA